MTTDRSQMTVTKLVALVLLLLVLSQPLSNLSLMLFPNAYVRPGALPVDEEDPARKKAPEKAPKVAQRALRKPGFRRREGGIDAKTAWSKDFTYKSDPGAPYGNLIKPVEHTYEDKTGDCEDYALVMASWGIAEGSEDMKLAWLWAEGDIAPSHVVATDGDHVYSSGVILHMNISEYAESHGYETVLTRSVGN